MPQNQVKSYRANLEKVGQIIKDEHGPECKEPSCEEKKLHPGQYIDLTVDLPPDPITEEESLMLKSFGITTTVSDFFAATTEFYNIRGKRAETAKETFYFLHKDG